MAYTEIEEKYTLEDIYVRQSNCHEKAHIQFS